MMYFSFIWTIIFVLQFVTSSEGVNATLKVLPSQIIVTRVEDVVNITCQVLTDDGEIETPAYELEWNVPPSHKLLLTRMNITRYRNGLTLRIAGVQEADSGVYICIASHKVEETLVSNVTIAVVPKKGTCGRGFFVCGTKECIKNRFVCDGHRDCPDGSDESLSQCGTNPCNDKIPCDDGRCLDRKLCCDSAYEDMCHMDRLPLCCIKYLNSKLVRQQTSYESDMGFLQSTIYTIIGCAVTFIFIVTIMVVAVCRVHMKQAVMTPHPRILQGPSQRNSLFWTQRCSQDVESRVQNAANVQRNVPLAPSTNLLITCNISNGIQLVGHIVEPPPYSEVAEDPPNTDDPPPPYSSTENLSSVTTTECQTGHANSALLRPEVIVNREEEEEENSFM